MLPESRAYTTFLAPRSARQPSTTPAAATARRIYCSSGVDHHIAGFEAIRHRSDFPGPYRAVPPRDGEGSTAGAGALGSPQLLLLSGIGPRLYLSSLGIPVAHHSPYVGQFLFDNPRNGISIERGG
ncbi:hypothetical protein DM860_014651 [Cuscuta australis]|uniref:Glucose-methanol-choline oxidoreductase N-terminal domain-containing protein n=1 Tax=Cuscuta australis TaxID=267555 RepID=A0A328DM15_9ASTE|nr:hypothetical protein DM860_014651 [Cuscuta australis]